MKNRKIKNASNETLEIEVIRYFTNNNTEYLIYSLNEIDESGYIKLYASKIIGTKACIINDNEEWNLIKEIIKEVVRSNRDGSKLNIIDLDEKNLDDIILQDTRVFKLQGNLVNLLSENRETMKHHHDDIALIPDENSLNDEAGDEILHNFDYEDETDEHTYEDETNANEEIDVEIKEQINILIDKVNNLENKISSYEAMLNKIKNIIDNNLE